ncbi:MAG: ATP-binding protein [Paludibacteraceae bacterium]|nr:ATP-binding protein [Paludibacteraceae bacterium]
MQKIIINNFGPIKDAEIEIPPLLVLIGEQATGKSTIAKLIYFFKSLSNDFFSRYYMSENLKFDVTNDIVFPLRRKFYDYFGSTFHMDKFDITYHYNNRRSITLTLNEEKRLDAHLSTPFFGREDGMMLNRYKSELLQIRKEIEQEYQLPNKIALQQKQMLLIQSFSDKINEIFSNVHNDLSYIIAGRNATVGYSSFFDNMFASNLQKTIENQGKRAFMAKEQTIDETLMLDFMQRVSVLKQIMNKSGDFDGLVRNADPKKQVILAKAHQLINKVIRGEYISSTDEKIVVADGKYVYLKNASSGQQEAIRILQDAFVAIMSDDTVFRIIEEPEAHIFPEAQMYLLQLLAMLLNNKDGNQLIITTHSPYVLTVINNLMFAHKVGQKSPDKAKEIVEKESWLAPEKVNAYMLSTSNGVERIIDDELSMIKAERIDEVSEKLNDDYDKLLNIEYED